VSKRQGPGAAAAPHERDPAEFCGKNRNGAQERSRARTGSGRLIDNCHFDPRLGEL
jgi:hypothetical protein